MMIFLEEENRNLREALESALTAIEVMEKVIGPSLLFMLPGLQGIKDRSREALKVAAKQELWSATK